MLTYLFYRLQKFIYGSMLVLFICIISGLNVGYKLYMQQVVQDTAITELGGTAIFLVDKYESSGYLDTLTRVGSVSVGCFTGYLLHLYSIGRIKEWPSWLTSKSAIAANLFGHFLMFSLPLIAIRMQALTGQKTDIVSFCIGNMIAYTIWPILNSILIISMVTVHAKHVLIRFMGHPIWHITNKLALTILLIQYEIIMFGWMQVDSSPTDGLLIDAIKVGTFGIFFSIIIAYFIYLFVEAPLNHLVMHQLGSLLLTGKAIKQQQEALDKQYSLDLQKPDEQFIVISKKTSS